MPSTFTVVSTDDAGPGTLRQAIVDSNAHVNDASGPDRIEFNIGAGGPQSIKPLSNLPAITDPIVIDGTTQPGWSVGRPVIELSGQLYDGYFYFDPNLNYYTFLPKTGLIIHAGDSTVRGLVVNRYLDSNDPGFDHIPFSMDGPGGYTVQGNYFGTDLDGTAFIGGGTVSVYGSNNLLGGLNPGDGNVFDSNVNMACSDSLFLGNLVGLDRTGTLTNRVFIPGEGFSAALLVGPDQHSPLGPRNTIGGTSAAARNVFARGGIYIGTTDNVFIGNYVGTDVSGTKCLPPLPMEDLGIGVGGHNRIGGPNPGEGNIIVGFNKAMEVSSDSVIQGNRIDFDVNGNALGSAESGFDVDGGIFVYGDNNLIGGDQPGDGNVMSPLGSGISFIGGGDVRSFDLVPHRPTGNIVQGNRVGVLPSDSIPGGSALGLLLFGCTDNIIGGTSPGAGNVFSYVSVVGYAINNVYNQQDSFIGSVRGGPTEHNVFQGNIMHSLSVSNASNNLFGGTEPGAGNNFSFISLDGLPIYENQWTDSLGHPIPGHFGTFREFPDHDNVFQGNRIGVDPSGTIALPQGVVDIYSASGTVIGGTEPGAGNQIAGFYQDPFGYLNPAYSIWIFGPNTIVQGNLIGTDFTGTKRIDNAPLGSSGIIVNADNVVIGGTAPAAGNVIANSHDNGILIESALFDAYGDVHLSKPTIQGNFIGTDRTGTIDLGNRGAGIDVEGSALVGGTAQGAGNVVAFNHKGGIVEDNTTSPRVEYSSGSSGGTFLENLVYDNGVNGIDLTDLTALSIPYPSYVNVNLAGPTFNDSLGHFGSNHFQNYPVLSSVTTQNGSTTVAGTLDSEPGLTYTVEFFANSELDPNGFAEGRFFVGRGEVTTDAAGHADFSFTFAGTAPQGQWITATATHPDGSTSEFSPPQTVETADLAVSMSVDTLIPFEHAPFHYTLAVHNNGGQAVGAVDVRDTLPGLLEFLSATASQGAFDPASGLWRIGDLQPGASATLVLEVRAAWGSATQFFRNSAAIVTASGVDSDVLSNRAHSSGIAIDVPFQIVPHNDFQGSEETLLPSFLVATIYDPDPTATPADYAEWFNKTDQRFGVTFVSNPNGGVDVYALPHSFLVDEGTYSFDLLIYDKSGAHEDTIFTYVVNPVPLAITTLSPTAVEGTPFNDVVAVINRPFGDALEETATITWDDGQVTIGYQDFNVNPNFRELNSNYHNEGFFITRRTFPEAGAHHFHIKIVDPDGSVAESDGVIQVADAPLYAGAWRQQQFTLTSPGDYAFPLVPGSDGAMWYIEVGNHPQIGRATLDGATTFFQFTDPTVTAFTLTAGPDGNMWFVGTRVDAVGGQTVGVIGRLTPAGAMTLFDVPDGAVPHYITTGPNGDLWFSVFQVQGLIGRITPAGVITLIPYPHDGPEVTSSIAMGPDGNLWFLAYNQLVYDVVHMYRRNADGTFSTRPIPDQAFDVPPIVDSDIDLTMAQLLMFPNRQVAEPDGGIWYTAQTYDASFNQISAVVHYDPATGDKEGLSFPSFVSGFFRGPQDSIWYNGDFSEQYAVITAPPESLTATAGQLFSGVISGFTDGNSFGQASDFSVTIDWGDGQTSLGTVSAASPTIALDTNGSPLPPRQGFFINGNHIYAEAGHYTVTPHIQSLRGSTLTTTVSINVLSVTNPGTQNSADGDKVSLPIVASGLPTGDSWTFAATGLPAGLSINPVTGVITGTVTDGAKACSVTVTASDNYGGSASQSFTWNVSILSMTNPGTQVYVAGSNVSLPSSASGLPTGDTWAYSVTGLPASLSINMASGVITGTVTDAAKAYSVTVTASDGHGGRTSQPFTFFVLGSGVTAIGTQLYIVGGKTSNDQVQVNSAGSSNTGNSGVKVNATLNGVNTQTTYNQSFTTIYIFLQNGNENIQLANSLSINAVVTAGNGNDNVQLGNGNNIVTLGNGNDQVHAGNGSNTVKVGNGNDNLQLGNGTNVVIAGTGNDNIHAGDGANNVAAGAVGSHGNIQVQLGNGANNLVTLLGNGNDQVQAGNGAYAIVSITGDGNDHVQLGDGASDTVIMWGSGNDQVQVGNGKNDSVSITGNGNEDIQTGNGTGKLKIVGIGHRNLHLGSGWTQI